MMQPARHTERHFSVRTLAEMWCLSEDTVRDLFRDVDGVFKIAEKRRGKREYMTLRIPESVAMRIHAERSKVKGC